MMVPSGTQAAEKELIRLNVWTKPYCGTSNRPKSSFATMTCPRP